MNTIHEKPIAKDRSFDISLLRSRKKAKNNLIDWYMSRINFCLVMMKSVSFFKKAGNNVFCDYISRNVLWKTWGNLSHWSTPRKRQYSRTKVKKMKEHFFINAASNFGTAFFIPFHKLVAETFRLFTFGEWFPIIWLAVTYCIHVINQLKR